MAKEKKEDGYFEGFPGAYQPAPGVIPIGPCEGGYLTDRGETVLPVTWAGYMEGKGPDEESGEEKTNGTD